MNTNDKRWFHIWGAYFRNLNKHEIQIWEDELSERFNDNYSEDEVIKAIKNLAEMKRKGLIEWAVGCNEIITQIIKERYEAMKARGDVQVDRKCALCTGGWMGYFEDTRTHAVGKKINGRSDFIVPCLCSQGRKILDSKYPSEKWDRMTELAERVKEWKLSIPKDTEDDDLMRYAI